MKIGKALSKNDLKDIRALLNLEEFFDDGRDLMDFLTKKFQLSEANQGPLREILGGIDQEIHIANYLDQIETSEG